MEEKRKNTNTIALSPPVKLFCNFFIVIGVVLILFGVYFTILSNEASSWPSVKGSIANTRIQTHISTLNNLTTRSTFNKTYYPEITYSWIVDGKSFKGTRYGLGYTHPKYPEKTKAKKAAKNFLPGTSIKVFYNPNSPKDAVINRSEKIVSYIPLLMGLFFLAVGLLFLRLSSKLEEGYRHYMENQRKPR